MLIAVLILAHVSEFRMPCRFAWLRTCRRTCPDAMTSKNCRLNCRKVLVHERYVDSKSTRVFTRARVSERAGERTVPIFIQTSHRFIFFRYITVVGSFAWASPFQQLTVLFLLKHKLLFAQNYNSYVKYA